MHKPSRLHSFNSRSEVIFFSLFILFFGGLLFSRFLLSVSMILIFLHAILSKDILKRFKIFAKATPYLLVSTIFLICLVSWFNSADSGYFWDRLRIKLPFLILPIAFVNQPGFTKDNFYRIIYCFFVIITSICLFLLGKYILNPSYYNDLYKVGKTIPTPIHHIRFSLMVNIAFLAGVYLIMKKKVFKSQNEKYFQLVGISFLAVFLHLLAVRSGMLTLYGLLIFLIAYLLFAKSNWRVGISVGLITLIIAGLSYVFVPTIQNKVGYTIYSVNKFLQNEDIRDLSDSRRLGSIEAGLQIGREHPWVGVGLGDIKYATNEYLTTKYPLLKDLGLLPHNQYIFFLASMGLIGLALFLFCTFGPAYFYQSYRDVFFIGINIIFGLSFLVEHTLETQLGTAIFIYFYLLSLTFQRCKEINDA